jgi:hypothetical protein
VVLSSAVHETLRQHVKAVKDPVSFPTPFPIEELPPDPSVVRLLPLQFAPPEHVPLLNHGDLGERNGGGVSSVRGDAHPIEGALVGIEPEEGEGHVGAGGWLLEMKDDPVGGDVELFDPETRSGEHRSMVLGEANAEGGPDRVAQRDADPLRDGVEVERLVVRP